MFSFLELLLVKSMALFIKVKSIWMKPNLILKYLSMSIPISGMRQ